MGKMGKIIAAQRKERKINERRNNYWAAEIYNRRHYIIISRAINFPLPFIFHWGALILARDFLCRSFSFALFLSWRSIFASAKNKRRLSFNIFISGALYFGPTQKEKNKE